MVRQHQFLAFGNQIDVFGVPVMMDMLSGFRPSPTAWPGSSRNGGHVPPEVPRPSLLSRQDTSKCVARASGDGVRQDGPSRKHALEQFIV